MQSLPDLQTRGKRQVSREIGADGLQRVRTWPAAHFPRGHALTAIIADFVRAPFYSARLHSELNAGFFESSHITFCAPFLEKFSGSFDALEFQLTALVPMRYVSTGIEALQLVVYFSPLNLCTAFFT